MPDPRHLAGPGAGARRTPADHAARRAAVDASRSWIVQAPAGSGKTELLIQRYLALLARVEQPEAILAITFTRKAAAEMRERIAAALDAAAHGDNARDSNHAFTLELADAALERDRAAGWNLRDNPSRLRVETIDAFCASIARGMPLLSGFGAMPEIAENAAPLYREAARRTLRLLDGSSYAPAMERLALHLDNDLRRVQSMLETMLARRDQWMRHIGAGLGDSDRPGVRRALEAELARVVEHSARKMRNVLPDGVESETVSLINFSQSAGIHALDSATAWKCCARLLLTNTGAWRATFNATIGFPPNARMEKHRATALVERLKPREDLRQALTEIRALPDPVFTDRQWAALEALLDVLPAAAGELKLTFRDTGQTDFVELSQAARLALGDAPHPTDLALALGDRIEHILLDEFQDTSLSQIDLLERLTAGWDHSAARTLFLVGDPMQSIYRFREAEVGLFLRTRVSGVGALSPEPLTLTVNFRTRPEVLDWINHTFAAIFPGEEDVALGAVPYMASDAFREHAAGARVDIHPFFEDDPAAEARHIAELLATRKSSAAAVLVRARLHAISIVRALEQAGIAYRAVDLDPLAVRPEVEELLALTRALLRPADRVAWLALLRAPWCGASLEELLAVANAAGSDPIWPSIPETPRFARLREVFGGALTRIRRVPLRQCVEQAWRALGGEATLRSEAERNNAGRFLDLLDELGESGAADLRALDARVARLFAATATQAENAVEIMTIHRAKGLEFDWVIVPALSALPATELKPLLRWDEIPLPDGDALVIAPVEAKEDSDDPVFQYLAALDKRKSRLEAARLLYVAATRAREQLHLCGHVEAGDEGLKPPRGESLLSLLWPAVEGDFLHAYEQARGGQLPLPLDPARTIRRLDPAWRLPAAAPDPQAARDESGEEEPVTFEWVGGALRHAGTVVHQALEHLARGLPEWPPDRIRARLAALGVPPADMDRAVSIAERAIAATLTDPRGRWILARRDIEACEFTASVAIAGVVHRCVIDRTFVEGGVRWVIDYKTSDIAGGGRETFLDNEVERYRARMERYRRLFQELEDRPVRLGLYFPLLAAWREW
ncbi:MAG: UvrD-helicase domain-containing protein [Bryobacteraceae bacterium]